MNQRLHIRMRKDGRVQMPAALRHALGLQAEVLAKLPDTGPSEADLAAVGHQLPLQVLPFSARQAGISGNVRPATRPPGVSLGDRCCRLRHRADPVGH